jgi:DNA-binding LytR/AlgR family response regulator
VSAYIIKPFDEHDLSLNIDLALFKHKKEFPKPADTNKIFVKKNQELIALQSDQIFYIEAYDNYSNVFTEDQKYLVSHTLKKIEEKLSPKGFIRIHKSYLVNFEQIEAISEGMVFLGEYKLPIGKAYRSQLQEFLVTL